VRRLNVALAALCVALLGIVVVGAVHFEDVATALRLQGDKYASSGSSAGWAYGVFGALAALAVLLLSDASTRRNKLAAMARGAVRATLPTRPGPVVLAGVVEAEDGAAPVRVTIFQQGTEYSSKGNYSVTWREQSRDLFVSPFRLRLADGTTVRVEPGDAVALVDDLDQTARLARDRRSRGAKLSPGESCFIAGVLRYREDPAVVDAGGYREQRVGKALVLCPPPSGPMAISTRPREDLHLAKAARYAKWAKALFVMLLGTHAFMATYHLRVCRGEQVVATVANKSTYTTKNKNRTTVHYQFEFTVPNPEGDAFSYKDDVSNADFNNVPIGARVDVVQARFGRGGEPNLQIGPRPALSTDVLGLALLAWVGAAIAYFVTRQLSLAWHERSKLVETAPGRLE
jgi:hypothetical protein